MSNQPGQGRPPKTSTIAERNTSDANIRIPEKVPPPPRHLTNDERQVWWRVGWELIQARLFTQIDQDVLANYCRAYCRYVEAYHRLEHQPWVVMTAAGSEKKNPLFDVADKAHEQMLQLMRELGLTPASRTKLPKPDRGRRGGSAASSHASTDKPPRAADPRKAMQVVK